MCEWNNGGITVDLPDGMCTEKQNRTVCIDECIVEQIKALWAAGFETRGCCCGHGKERPSVVMAEGYKDMEIAKISEVLKESDPNRSWHIMQWRLQTVLST